MHWFYIIYLFISLHLHQKGHVLGLGTYWMDMCGDCNTFKYQCPAAKKEFEFLFNSAKTLEIDHESCSHWAGKFIFPYMRKLMRFRSILINAIEKSFTDPVQSELMTPYFEAYKYQPITTVTVAALHDLGYEVSMDAADVWTDNNSEGSRLLSNTGEILFPRSSFVMNNTNMAEPKAVVKFII